MSAPNLKEIEWAISELENQESSETRYSLLAALYICRNELTGSAQKNSHNSVYSSEFKPREREVEAYGDSEFLCAVNGKDQSAVWGIIDDLMDTLHVANPRVYDSVMRKMRNL